MEDLVEQLAGGHVTAVKIVLTSVIVAVAVYQVLLMAVTYGKIRTPYLEPDSAATTHRTVGDALVALVLFVGLLCLMAYGIEDSVREGAPGPDARVPLHVAASFALVPVLGLKLLVLHRWHRASRFLPLLGIGVLTLLFVTWLTSAGAFLVA